MKKSLFFILFNILMVFIVSGCGEESGNNSDGATGNDGDNTNMSTQEITTPTLDNLTTLQGTYNIEFFYTDGANIAVLTTDCSKVQEYAQGKKECTNPDDSLEHYGRVTVKVNEDNSVKVLSKLQMFGKLFEGSGIVVQMAKGNTYNFNEFPTIPSNVITKTGLNESQTVKGVSGRNATQEIGKNGAEGSTFVFTLLEDGTLVNNMVDKSVLPANVVIRMKKISDTVEVLKPNKKYDNPVIDNFDNTVNYKLKNN